MPSELKNTPLAVKGREDRERLEEVKAMYLAGRPPTLISKQTGVARSKISAWATRYKWGKLRETVLEKYKMGVAATVGDTLDTLSQRAKSLLSNEILAQAQVLNAQPPVTYTELVTTKEIQGRAQTVRHLTGAAKDVFPEWQNVLKPNTLFHIGKVELLSQEAQSAAEVIDVDNVDIADPEVKSLREELEAIKKQNEELRLLATQAADEVIRLESQPPIATPQPVVPCGVKKPGPVDITPAE